MPGRGDFGAINKELGKTGNSTLAEEASQETDDHEAATATTNTNFISITSAFFFFFLWGRCLLSHLVSTTSPFFWHPFTETKV